MTQAIERRVQVQNLSDAIDDAERKLQGQRSLFLQCMGWERTCNTPGSYWLWKRDFSDVDARWKEIEAENDPFPTPHKPIGIIVTNEDSAIIMSRASLNLLYGEHPEFNDD